MKAQNYASNTSRTPLSQRIISIILSVMMLLGNMTPVAAMADEVLVCTQTVHAHDASCYERQLTCGEAEREAVTHSVRTKLACTFEGHKHTDECRLNGELICGVSTDVYHKHDDNCYAADGTLACGMDEVKQHRHGDDCYDEAGVLTCKRSHEHTSDCFYKDEQGRKIYTCGQMEIKAEHQHSGACWVTEAVVDDLGHQHVDACYTNVLICTEPEHQHSASCYEDVPAPTAEPTVAPTAEPTAVPTEEPTVAPTAEPTEAPTEEPTEAPTEEPTEAPTEEPTEAPTEEPTETPTEEPTEAPAEQTVAPLDAPDFEDIVVPTAVPARKPLMAAPRPMKAPTPGNGGSINMSGVQFDDASTLSNGSIGATFNADIEIDLDVAKTALWGGNDSVTATIGGISVSDDMCGRWYTGKATGFSGTPYYFTFEKNDDGTVNILYQFTPEYIQAAEAQQATRLKGKMGYSCTLDEVSDKEHGNAIITVDGKRVEAPVYDGDPEDNKYFDKEISTTKSASVNRSDDGKTLVTYTIDVTTWNGTPGQVTINDVINQNDLPAGLTMTPVSGQVQYIHGVYENNGNSYFEGTISDSMILSTTSVTPTANGFNQTLPALPAHDPLDRGGWSSEAGYGYRVTLVYDATAITASGAGQMVNNNVTASSGTGPSNIEAHGSAQANLATSVNASKNAEFQTVDGQERARIKWTISIDNNGVSLADKVLKDDMFPGMNASDVTITVKGSGADGSSHWTFNNSGSTITTQNGQTVNAGSLVHDGTNDLNSYEITYYTDLPAGQRWPDAADVRTNNFDFNDKPGSKSITITPNTISTGKYGQLAGDRSYIEWTITITNDHKDIAGQQLLDAMIDESAYGFTYVETSAGDADASSKWKQENGKLVNQASSPDYGSYKITYRTPVADPYPEQKVTVVNDYTFLGEPGHSNGVDINPGTVNPGKKGELADDRSKITWTLTLNNDHADLHGVTITDPMLANATLVSVTDLNGTDISGAWEIHTNDDGSKVLLNLKTEKDNNSYIITYTTPVAESDRYPKDTQYVTNSGHIAKWDKYFSDTVEIPGETDAVQGVEKVLTDNTPVTDATGKQSLTWTGTIHLNAGLLRADTIFGDRMYYATDYNQQEQPQQHYMTGAELKRVTGVIVEKLGVTCDIWAVQNNQTVYSQNIQDDGHYTGFGVKVTADTKIASAQDIEFTYNTVADFGSASDVVKYFRNGLRVNNNNEVTDQWKHTTTLIKQDGDGKNVDTYPELNKDNKTLKWKIAYTPSQTGLTEVTLIDTLPEHVTIKEVSAQNNNLTEGQERDLNGVKFTWTTTTGDDGRQSVSVLMKKSDGLPTDTIYFVLTCEAQDLEELTADWEVGTKDVVFDASNSARVVGDGELPPVSQTQHVKYEKPVPPPAKVADKSYYYDPDDDTDHLLHYSVQINPNGETLNKGKALKLTDVLAYQNGYTDANHAWYDRDIVLDASSVKLYYAAIDDDGNVVVDANGQMIKGNAVSPTQWNMSTKTKIYNDPNDYNLNINGITYFRDWNGLGGKNASDVVERDITFTVPDARPLVLEYAYKVTMTVPKVDGKWQEVDLGVVANSVTLNGVTDTVTTSGDKYKVSDAWSNLGDQHVYKVERGNQANSLDGATFVVYRDSDDGVVKTYVTKNGGFDLSPDDYDPNTIYYFEETQAPVGYVKADDRVYFYWSSGKTPSALTNRIEALYKQGIVVHDLTKSNDAYYAENDKLATSTKVTKKWDDNNDENGMRPARITAVLTRFAVPDDVYATLNVEQSQQEPEKFDFSVVMDGRDNNAITSNTVNIPEGASVDVTVTTVSSYGYGVAVYVDGVEADFHYEWGYFENVGGTLNFTIPNVTSNSDIKLYVTKDSDHGASWGGPLSNTNWTINIENGGGGSAGGKDFDAASWAIIKGYRDNNYQGETAILSAPLWAATWDDLDTIGTMVDANGNTVGVHYVYDVSEVAVNGYKTTVTGSGTTEDGFEYTLENKYTGDRHEPTTLSVKKEWSGIDTPASSVQIKLLRKNLKTGADELYAYNGSTVHTVVGGNTFTFKNLPYKVNGEVLYSYAVIEVVPEGATFEANYYVEQNGVRTPIDEGTFVETPDTSIVLVNAKKEETTTAAVTKEWDLVSGEDWPEGITVNAALYQKVGTADATVYDTQPLTADKPTYSWSKLPKKVNGATATYYVVETTTLDGYTTTYNGQTDPASQAGQGVNITITNTQKTTSVKAKKSFVGPDENGQPVAYDWPVDANGQPITITLRLTRNGEEVEGSDKTTNSVDNVLTWTNLPKLDADGEEITYSVIEVNTPAGFVSGIAEPDEDDDVIAIVNKATALLVTKVWKLNGEDYTFANGETLNVTYTIAPKAGTNTPAVKLTEDNFISSDLGSRVTLDSDTQFTVAYTENAESVQVLKLPVGEYTITESTSPEGWMPAKDSADADLKNLFSDAVTFTNEKYTTSVRVNKQWKDTTGAAMNWPDGINSITVTLKRDGSDFDTQALTADNLPYTWPDLDKINPDTGKDYVYTVEETAIPGYTTVVAADPNANGAPNANLITNTYAPGATTATVWVKKVYKGNATADKTFSFSLHRDTPSGEEIETITITGQATNHFAALNFTKPGNFTYYVVEEQPAETEEGWVYDENNARPITISVDDDGNGGLVATVQDGTQTNAEQNPVTFTNTYQHTQATIYVRKTVEGNADELKDHEFEFELLDYRAESFNPPVKVKVKPGQTVSFPVMDFYTSGTYGYYVREIKPVDAADHITYDEKVYSVLVLVDQDTNGALYAQVNLDADGYPYITEEEPLEIVNKYQHIEVPIYVTKTVDGLTADECDVEFEFQLLDSDGKPLGEEFPNVKIKAGETGSFGPLEFYAPLEFTYGYIIREIKPADAPDYITYSNDYEVNLDVTEDEDTHQLVARVYAPGTDEDITEDAPAEIVNTYVPASVDADLYVQKIIEGANAPAAEKFTFELYKVTAGEDGQSKDEMVDTLQMTGADTGKFTVGSFDEPGTYTYKVKERNSHAGGWTYDTTVYTVTVEVTDDKTKHELVATVKKADGSVITDKTPMTFTNTYAPEETVAEVWVKKVYTGSYAPNAVFGFYLYEVTTTTGGAEVETLVNQSPAPILVRDGMTSILTNTFDAPGTYVYRVKEMLDDQAGWTYDKTVKEVTVEVTDNGDGTMTAVVMDGDEENTKKNPVVFTNEFTPASATIYAKKEIDGLSDYTTCPYIFDFELLDGEDVLDTISVKAGETDAFETLVFSETGTFTYTIHEIEPDNAPEYVTYSAVYTDVVIVVSEDPTTHALSATVYLEDEQTEVTAGYPVLVTNIYKPTPVDASIWVKKAYAGGNAPDETFEFKLYEVITTEEGEEEEQYIAAKTITGEGTATFDMNYDEVGEHTYHVKETNSGKTGWTYDTTVKTITVKVSDDLTNHSLVAEVKEGTADNSEQNPAAFSNTFAPATATIWAKKTIDGMDDSDCDAEFEFELLDENKQRIDGVSSITVTAGGKGAFQTLYFNESDKTYVYYVHEVQPENKLSYIDYDDTYYAVTVETATDADTNTLTATVVDADQADVTETTPVVVTNTYVPGKTSAEIYVEKIYEGDNTPTRARFTFGLYLVGEDGQESSDPINTVTITGEDTSSFHMAYDEPGTYTYHVKEMPGTLGGWVYDTAVKTVTVTVVDNNDGTMTATVKEGTAANNVNNPVTFTNSFTPVTAQISVKKTMSGIEDEDCGVSFEFRLLDWNENPVEGVSNVTVAAGQTKEFAAITFNEEGTYTYYVQEIKPADAPDYITYDTTPHEVVIEVSSDETTNALIAQVFVGDDEITAQDPLAITNTYQPAETSAEIYIKKNYSGSRMPTGSTFTFSLYEVDKDGNEAEEPIRTKTITGATQGSFDSMTYDEPGTYTYHVKETIGTEAGWSYDATVKTVTVTVTDNKSGSLVAVVKEGDDVNNADNPVTFTNLFTPVTAQISVQKAMNGIADEDCGETFEFQLLDPELNPLVLVDNVKIKAGETGSFVPFTFNKVGSYPYYLQEIKPDNAPDYITYDETPYLVTVVVSRDETTNALKAQVVAGEDEITAQNPLVITNTYTAADAKATVWVKKAYTGKNPPTETFEFTLYSVTKDADGKNAETKVGESITITGQETASFPELSFSAEGAYTYKVKETITDEQTGWSSTGDKTVTITVTDNHDGTMTAVVKEGETTVTQSAPVVITNNYDAGQAKAKIWVEKTYDGDDTDDEEFTFALYTVTTTQSGGTVETWAEDLTITGEDKAAFSELVYTDAGTYTYKVKEVNDEKPGWTYDERFERTVTVTVTDNGKGSLSAVVKEGTATVTEDAPVTFVNEYTTTQITVQKTWTGYGANGAISMTWPNPDAKITFELHRVDADGSDTVLEEVILTADVQSKTWTLPDDGSTYYAVETKVENVYGFTSNVNHGNKDSALSSGTITIKNTQQFVSKQATKSWTMLNDQITWPEGMTVTIDLLRDGKPFVTDRVLSATSRTWTFYNLPKIDPLTGEDYVYTVAEKKIQYNGVTVPADWFTVTENGLSISNAEQSTAITAAKAWINEDGTTTWPKDENGENLVITLNLFRVVEGEDDLQVGTITLNGEPAAQTPANVTISADGASVTWSKLPKYIGRSSNGTVLPCTYYVTETGLDGYETYFDLNSDPTKAVKASGTIAVQNIQLVDITARKAWVNADQSTTWPTLATGAPIPVTFHLLRNGVSMGADYDRTITSAQDVTWTDLRAGNAATGETYTYTVSEDNVKSYRPGSIVKGDDGVFTVTNTQIATSVTAEKVWQNADGTADGNTDWPVDADGTPVTVTLHLLRNGVQLPAAYDRQLAANGDTAIWLNLPEQDDNGDDYVYTVDEDAVPGYDKQITQNPDETWTITNAQQQTSLTARKAWVNAGVLGTDTTTWPVDESGAPVAVTLHLLRDGSDMGTSFQKTVTTGDAVTWSNLPAKDLTGRTYVYSVSEDAITGYDVSFTENSTGATVVTNTEQKTSITAAKAWVNDDASATWPVDENGDAIIVTLTLHQVYGTTDAILGTVTLDADNQSVTWPSLPAYKFGKACTYYVTEAAVDSYITTYQSGAGDETDDAADTAIGSGTLTVTNTNHNEKTTSLTLNKRWIYENSHETAYPDGVSATFHLEYTDLAVDGDIWHAYQVNGETVTYTVNADNGWSIETGELPFQSRTGGKFDYNYQYKVVEDSFVTVDGTESAPDVESDAVTEGSVTLTNVMPNRTSINVKKVWDGGDHIPGSITVTLMQTIAAGEEGVAYAGQATVTAKGTDSVTCAAGKYTLTSGDWTSALFTFSDLPRYDTVDGQKVEYKYYVVEESVDNYVTTYSHDASEPVNEGETITVTNTLHVSYELPLTGGSGTTLIYLLGTAMAMLAAMGLTAQKIRRRKETD